VAGVGVSVDGGGLQGRRDLEWHRVCHLGRLGPSVVARWRVTGGWQWCFSPVFACCLTWLTG
jgi:hypothetical protein